MWVAPFGWRRPSVRLSPSAHAVGTPSTSAGPAGPSSRHPTRPPPSPPEKRRKTAPICTDAAPEKPSSSHGSIGPPRWSSARSRPGDGAGPTGRSVGVGTMERMDPYAVLGLPAGASEDEVSEAYRRLAKRHHPDHDTAPDAAGRMATVNVAYDLLRSSFRHRRPNTPRPTPNGGRPAARPMPAGAWLPESVRRALGTELLSVLLPREQVRIVTPAATWASPRTLLAVSDQRLLWLLDDAPLNRVRVLRFRDIAEVRHALGWPRRRRAVLRVRTK